jgi:hypothetical protein
MRKLYLHIGLHKTGTTYLQKLALENRDILRQNGLGLAPFIDPALGTHHPILAAIERAGPRRVLARVAARNPGLDTLVSAEELSRHLEDEGRARALRDAARAHFDAVRLVVFLRRQDFLKESYYAEQVKLTLQGSIAETAGLDGDHAARLARLEAVFGEGSLAVRLYRDPGPNDVVGDFLSALELDLDPSELRPVERLNASLHRRKVVFLSHVPKARRPGARRAFLPHLMRRHVTETAAIRDDGGRFLMPPAARRAMVARHLEGNRAIVARYRLARAEGFVSLPDADPAWTPPAPISPAETRAVALGALRRVWTGRGPVAALKVTAGLGVLLARTAWRIRAEARAAPRRPAPAAMTGSQPAYQGGA